MSTRKVEENPTILGRPGSEPALNSLFARKLHMIMKGKKRDERASLLGVSVESYRNYISGTSMPNARALAHLAESTGVNLNWLLDDNRGLNEDPFNPGPPLAAEAITNNEAGEDTCLSFDAFCESTHALEDTLRNALYGEEETKRKAQLRLNAVKTLLWG